MGRLEELLRIRMMLSGSRQRLPVLRTDGDDTLPSKDAISWQAFAIFAGPVGGALFSLSEESRTPHVSMKTRRYRMMP